jgi:tRNA (cytidine/uridine-2'-O-)-methyltransferase
MRIFRILAIISAPYPKEFPVRFPLSLALYEPDIPQNAGTLMRFGACMGIPVHLIEPAGFPTSDKSFLRAGMDYLQAVTLIRHISFARFDACRRETGSRLILATTKGATPYYDFAFQHGDIVMMGRESAGVPPAVHEAADARITIPLKPPMRSLNVAVAAAMILGEAMRQTNAFPAPEETPV